MPSGCFICFGFDHLRLYFFVPSVELWKQFPDQGLALPWEGKLVRRTAVVPGGSVSTHGAGRCCSLQQLSGETHHAAPQWPLPALSPLATWPLRQAEVQRLSCCITVKVDSEFLISNLLHCCSVRFCWWAGPRPGRGPSGTTERETISAARVWPLGHSKSSRRARTAHQEKRRLAGISEIFRSLLDVALLEQGWERRTQGALPTVLWLPVPAESSLPAGDA